VFLGTASVEVKMRAEPRRSQHSEGIARDGDHCASFKDVVPVKHKLRRSRKYTSFVLDGLTIVLNGCLQIGDLEKSKRCGDKFRTVKFVHELIVDMKKKERKREHA